MIFFLSILKKSGVDPLVQSLEHYPELVQVKKKKREKGLVWPDPIKTRGDSNIIDPR
jgi:hypothetical protein